MRVFTVQVVAAFFLLLCQPAFADRKLATFEDLSASLASSFRCGRAAQVYVDADSRAPFTGEQRALQFLIGGVRTVLKLECDRLEQIEILGRVERRVVWRGYAQASNNWAVSERLLRAVDAPAERRQRSAPRQRGRPTLPDGAPGSLLAAASSEEAKCDAVFAWARRLKAEYPSLDLRHTVLNRLYPLAVNLYSDEHFIPFYGQAFDTLDQRERQDFAKGFIRSCAKSQAHRAEWVELNHFITRPFLLERGSFSYAFVGQWGKQGRQHRKWIQEALGSMEALSAEEESWAALKRLEAEGGRHVSQLWPSEKSAFSAAIARRQTSLANDIARQAIETVAIDASSLRVIDTIVSTATSRLGGGKVDAGLLDLADAKKATIRTALADAEIRALRGVPATGEGLIRIAQTLARLEAELGEVPPSYRVAAKERASEIMDRAVTAHAETLDRLPARFESLAQAKSYASGIQRALEGIAPDEQARFKGITDARLAEIVSALEADALSEIAALKVESWRTIAKISEKAQEWAERFERSEAPGAGDKVKSVAETKIVSLIPNLQPSFELELNQVVPGWSGFSSMQKIAGELTRLKKRWSQFESYLTAFDRRRAELVHELETESLRKIEAAGGEHGDLASILALTLTEAESFEKIGETDGAAAIMAAGRQRADAVAASSLEEYLDSLEGIVATPDVPSDLEAHAQRFEQQGELVPTLRLYAEAAHARADDIRTELCREPFRRSNIDPEDGELLVMGNKGPISVFFFICALSGNGHQVTELEQSFWSKPSMKIKKADGDLVRLTLESIDVDGGREALVATSLAEANPEKEITVDQWRQYAGDLMRPRPDGIPDANGVTACDRLAADPEVPKRVTEGVRSDIVDIDVAIEACVAALEHNPQEARFHFQLGRALVLAGRDGEAVEFLGPAAEAGYPAAEGYVGDLLFADQAGGDEGFEAAMAFYRRAADGGYAPARKLIAELEGAGGGPLAVAMLKASKAQLLERIVAGGYDWSLAFPKKETALLGYAQGLAQDLGSWCPKAFPGSALEEVGMFQQAWYGDTTSRIFFKGGFTKYLEKLQHGLGQKAFVEFGKKDAESVALNWGCEATETLRLASNLWRLLAGRRPEHRSAKFEKQLVEEKVGPVSGKHAYSISTDGLSTPGGMRLDADMRQSRKMGLKVLECHYDTIPEDKYREVQYYWAPTAMAVLGFSAPILGGNFLMVAQQKLQEANGGRKVTHPFLTYGSPRAECPARLDPDRPAKKIYGPRKAVASAAPREVSEPKRSQQGCCYHIVDYGAVPEEFVPEIPADEKPGKGRVLVIKMEKANPGSLVRMSLQKFGWYSLTKSELDYRKNPRAAEALKEDVVSVFNQGAAVLECKYNSEKYGSVYFYRYWYKDRPKNTDATYLNSRISDHPLLLIRAPRTACPKDRTAAMAIQ